MKESKKRKEVNKLQEKEKDFEISLLEEQQDEGYKMPTVFSLYGDLDEEKAEQTVLDLFTASEIYKQMKEKEEETQEVGEERKASFIVSTMGGNVHDMFSIVDVLNHMKQYCTIETIGLGKVMSAGTGILMSGTKGLRKIGRNCRVMLHPVQSGAHGDTVNIKNEMKEVDKITDLFVDLMLEHTNMPEKEIKKYLNQDKNFYLSAEEAVEKGIADIII